MSIQFVMTAATGLSASDNRVNCGALPRYGRSISNEVHLNIMNLPTNVTDSACRPGAQEASLPDHHH